MYICFLSRHVFVTLRVIGEGEKNWDLERKLLFLILGVWVFMLFINPTILHYTPEVCNIILPGGHWISAP
jgi:hypothetical protein